jgi:hypothetical protein
LKKREEASLEALLDEGGWDDDVAEDIPPPPGRALEGSNHKQEEGGSKESRGRGTKSRPREDPPPPSRGQALPFLHTPPRAPENEEARRLMSAPSGGGGLLSEAKERVAERQREATRRAAEGCAFGYVLLVYSAATDAVQVGFVRGGGGGGGGGAEEKLLWDGAWGDVEARAMEPTASSGSLVWLSVKDHLLEQLTPRGPKNKPPCRRRG